MSSIRKILMKNYSVNKRLKFLLTEICCIIAGQLIAIVKQSHTATLDYSCILIRSCITFYIFPLTIRVWDSVCNCASTTNGR